MNDPDDTNTYQSNAAPPPAPDSGVPPVIGRYRVERVLGRGGFGRVFLAHDDDLHRPVAIKVPHHHRTFTAGDAGAYLSEARTVANLDHPHIVPVYDVGSTPDCACFIVSKFVAGRTLSQQIQNDRPAFDRAAEIVATVADALHYAHHRGVVHRDVKPGNILIDADGRAFVVDFGLALNEESADRGPSYAGTPAYMSPEQARGEGHRVDGRSDVFSLGVVFYELLSGRQPFRADSQAELLEQIAGFEPRPLRQCDEAVPKELERICLKALAKRASERYPTAKDMADDLRHFLSRRPEHATTAVVPIAATAPPAGSGGPTTPASEARPLKIVPKGLRSFDAHDADFFLELLPGPRDREGLPDSVRFWKTRLEEPDADLTFAVGLICGPSGCGKSSLVKAGLLPRLSDTVCAVYVEATAAETEARLLNGLRKRCPALSGSASLKDALAALRRGHGGPAGQKVVIVLDQFEQWLHARKDGPNSELVQALRQCDGGRVACVVLVRDDFWMAVIRFMRELEVRLLEGQNSAAVDLFDPDHARKVLTAFGRAFGKLPERAREVTAEQKAFVSQAVSGLAQDGKVVSVRLALFAEMMKGKAWTPAALKEVGGIEGVGATFLEETFGAATAPPEHRYHQQAARAVLRALLPEWGTDIKGHMRSHAELLEASGYGHRPEEFDDLIRILDGEVRLITPTDPARKDGAADAPPGARYFQLTHDYLVPSLRDWLTRKQKETRRGRAELLLADRAAVWTARPENRQLPSLAQWLGIRWLAARKDWTPPQQKMMRAAARYHAVRAALLVACLVALGLIGWEGHGRLQARTLRDRLLEATTTETPAVVADMAPYRRWVDPLLRDAHAQAAGQKDARKQLRASLALLPVDAGQASYLSERLLTGDPQEVATVRTALRPHAAAVSGRLWEVLVDPKADPDRRLRAACALAAYAPADDRWGAVSEAVSYRLATENPLVLKDWAEALRPVGPALLPTLANLVADAREPSERRTLARLYAEFAALTPDGFGHLERVPPAGSEGPPEARAERARRRATAVAALAAAGRWDDVWPLLRHTPDPTTRTYLIERLGTGGADALVVADRLAPGQEPDASARRALVLALADFGEHRLTPRQRDELQARLLALYRDDPDPGAHAAAGWLLRQWGQVDEARAVDRELASGGCQGQRQWYVTGQHQTMTVVAPGEIELPAPSERRKVRAERRFALGSREVTVAEFKKFRPSHPVDVRSAATEDCPVNEVSWYDAAAYCNWLSRAEGVAEGQWCYAPNADGKYAAGMKVKPNALSLTGYRLPTEDEWEYACRAGSTTRWSMGGAEDALGRYGWSSRNAGYHTQPVGLLRPNDLGLFDMHGNVWEWCQGRAKPEVVGDGTLRPLRGGTYINNPPEVRSDIHNENRAAHHTNADGFRLARTMPPPPPATGTE